MRKRTVTLLFLLAAIPLALVGYQYVNHSGKTRVIIRVAPETAQINVNGSPARLHTLYLKPGDYKFEAFLDGFSNDTTSMSIKSGDKNKSAMLLLSPVTDEAKNWLKNNPKIQKQREAIGGKETIAGAEAIAAKAPIVNKLPVSFRYFTISYDRSIVYPNDPTSVAILIHATTVYTRGLALKWIRDQGYDPSDYEIVFSDAPSPFTGVKQ